MVDDRRIPVPVVLLSSSLLGECVYDAQCVITAQLQQEPPGVISVSITMATDHTPNTPASFSQHVH